jgi:tetratricopeptide (TPR) repeat protein
MPNEPPTPHSLITAILLIFGAAIPAAADGGAACDPKVAPELRIRGCNDLIRSGGLADNDLAEAYITRGGAYAETSDHARALADFDEAVRLGEERATIESGSDDPDARRDLANAYHERGSFHVWRQADFDRGIADLDKAITLDPDLTAAYSARGWAYQASGDFERGNIDYEEAIRRNVDACPLSTPALHPS